MLLKKKRNYHETIHDAAIGLKEAMWESPLGIKSRFVGHCFFKSSQESLK